VTTVISRVDRTFAERKMHDIHITWKHRHLNNIINNLQITEYSKCLPPAFTHAFNHLVKFLSALLIGPSDRLSQIICSTCLSWAMEFWFWQELVVKPATHEPTLSADILDLNLMPTTTTQPQKTFYGHFTFICASWGLPWCLQEHIWGLLDYLELFYFTNAVLTC